MPGAVVTARQAATGTALERITDLEGRFFFPSLRIGPWDVTATIVGLTPQTHKVIVEIGRSLTVDFMLSVAGVTESVTVEARPPLLQS